MSGLLLARPSPQASCYWLRHMVRPEDWTPRAPEPVSPCWIQYLAAVRPQASIAPSESPAEIADRNQLYAELLEIYEKLQHTTLSVAGSLYALSRNRDQLLQLQEEIRAIRREMGIA